MTRFLRRRWEEHFLGAEATVAFVPPAILFIWFLWFGGTTQIDCFMHGYRADLYRTTTAISGTLLGISLAAASFALNSATSPRLAVVRESKHYSTLWKTFFQAARSLGLLAVVSLACMILDRDGSPNPWLLIFYTLFLGMSIIRLARVIWILEQIIKLVTGTSLRGRT